MYIYIYILSYTVYIYIPIKPVQLGDLYLLHQLGHHLDERTEIMTYVQWTKYMSPSNNVCSNLWMYLRKIQN